MLTYTDKKAVSSSVTCVLTAGLCGYIGVFTIDSGAHDDQTLQVSSRRSTG